ncbi:hypothetical protein JHK87_011929 [Glycine soja]|nr:hypothetical protein JHK87_011929 [Glycine soja]
MVDVAEECLKREKDRIAHYLHSSSEPKLLEKVQDELLSMYANQLLEKEHSGCHALLGNDKHVTTEGMALVKQVEDAASNKKVFVQKMIDLHDKYLTYENEIFQNHTPFHKALKEAFKVFCNKGVVGSSSVELLVSFYDNILKKGGREKLSDEAIEETLEKVTDFTLAKKNQTSFEDYLSNNPNANPGA